MKKLLFLLLAMGAVALIIVLNVNSTYAAPIVQVTEWGTIDTSCTYEGSACSADSAFNPSTGGYRAGGSVSWGFTFDPSAFASISSIELQVIVVGFLYEGNINPGSQMGNYLAIDSVPFAPFLDVTDSRDTKSFDIPSLTAGPHTFSVFAYNNDGSKYEGWAGVDYAKLTVTGNSGGGTPVPLPAAILLLGSGFLGLVGLKRKFRK